MMSASPVALQPQQHPLENDVPSTRQRYLFERAQGDVPRSLAVGDTVYILEAQWFEGWKNYSGYFEFRVGEQRELSPFTENEVLDLEEAESTDGPASKPGAISNDILFESGDGGDGSVLSKDLEQDRNYTFVTKEAWDLLVSWYDGGPAIPRKIVRRSDDTVTLDLWPLELTVCWVVDAQVTSFEEITVSRVLSVESLRERIGEMKHRDPRTLEMFARSVSGNLSSDVTEGMIVNLRDVETFVPLSFSESVEDCVVDKGDAIFVQIVESRPDDDTDKDSVAAEASGDESMAVDGIFLTKTTIDDIDDVDDEISIVREPVSPTTPVAVDDTYSDLAEDFRDYSDPKSGLKGLANLGNTCFMNSAFQCLVHSFLLTDYFLSPAVAKDINRSNPLGMKGRIAEEWRALLKELFLSSDRAGNRSASVSWMSYWGSRDDVVPRSMKATISSFAPQFMGFNQHDSQELLAFVLDGLHEDMNRVLKKEYSENPFSADDCNDVENSAKAWELHLKRNDSIVVDLLQAQYKSTVICPECSLKSTTFDPFMFLSLPLPRRTTTRITFTYVPCDGTVFQSCAVDVSKEGTVSELKDKISECLEIPRSSFMIAEIWNHRFFHYYTKEDESIGRIRPSDLLYVFESNCSECEEVIFVPVIHRFIEQFDDGYSSKEYKGYYYFQRNDAGGVPFLLCIPKSGVTIERIYEMIQIQMRRFVQFDALSNGDGSDSMDGGTEKDEQGTAEDDLSPVADDGPVEWLRNPVVAEEEDAEDAEDAEDGDGFNEDAPLSPSDSVDMAETSSAKESVEIDGENGVENEAETPVVDPESLSPFSSYMRVRTCDRDGKGSSRPLRTIDGEDVDFGLNQLLDLSEVGQEIRDLVLCIEWHRDVLRFYDESAETNTDDHPSVLSAERELKKEITLDSCLEAFTKEEKLTSSNPWFCTRCKDHRFATKTLHLFRLPKLLIIHLKRFEYTRYGSREKMDSLVTFPLTGLDLSEHCPIDIQDEPPIYDCFAVSAHFGGLGGGHYIAHAIKDGKWYTFDDSRVCPCSESDIVSSSAYVLFYVRRDANKPDVPCENSFVSSVRLKEMEEEGAAIESQGNEDRISDDDLDDLLKRTPGRTTTTTTTTASSQETSPLICAMDDEENELKAPEFLPTTIGKL